ncbi:hypothetical protein POM88_014122 [Heracleum sosnowskyi]|uniref:Uncharacterized protein n=1 Tax=Heracleum sosnowskyi TaxID=360622 RepID=A0AAD8J2F0_9APIA|nr:hypothetical protein POM88_014122 [Heracleum sosnowskyi]
MDEISFILGSSNLQKKRSSGKGKSSSSKPIQSIREKLVPVDVFSNNNKTSHLFSDGSAEGSLSILKVDNGSLPEMSPRAALEQMKSVSLAGRHHKLALWILRIMKELLRRNKFYVGDDQKKPKNGEDSCAFSMLEKQEREENSASCQAKKLHPKRELKEKYSGSQASKVHKKRSSKENSVAPRTSRPHRKHKDVSHVAAASLFEIDNDTKIDIPLKDEMVSAEKGHNEHRAEKLVVDILKCGDVSDRQQNIYLGCVPEVDRVLACEKDCAEAMTSDIKDTDYNAFNSKKEGIGPVSTEDMARTAGKKAMGESTNFNSDNDEIKESLEMSIPEENADAQWVGKSHLHNSWISESHLKVLSKRKLDNYKAKYGRSLMVISDEHWKRPQQHALPFSQGTGPIHLETRGASISEFQGKLALPKLPFDQKLLPRFPFPATNVRHPHPDLFLNLTYGSKAGNMSGSFQDFHVHFFPNMKFSREDTSRYAQGVEVNLMLGIGQMPQTYSSFPENHRKVLEKIMLRTGAGPNFFLRSKSIKDILSEDELDFLFVGVRRYGRGNWDAMLCDHRLKFSMFKTAEDLFCRWEEQQHKILDTPVLPVQKSFKSSV